MVKEVIEHRKRPVERFWSLGGDALNNDPKLVQESGKAAVVQAILTIFHRTHKKLKCINPGEYTDYYCTFLEKKYYKF